MYEVLKVVFKLYLYIYKIIGSFYELVGNVEESLFIRYVFLLNRIFIKRMSVVC